MFEIDPIEFYPDKWKDIRLTIMPVVSAFADGIEAFVKRMAFSFEEGTSDPITILFFDVDQNRRHSLGSVKKVLDWINEDFWSWEYFPTNEFCENLSWPMTRVY